MILLSPITQILLVVAVTAAITEGTILYSVPLFLICLVNELMLAWARRSTDD